MILLIERPPCTETLIMPNNFRNLMKKKLVEVLTSLIIAVCKEKTAMYSIGPDDSNGAF